MPRQSLAEQKAERERISNRMDDYDDRLHHLGVTIDDVNRTLNERLQGTERLVTLGFLVIVLTVVGVLLALFGLVFDLFSIRQEAQQGHNREEISPYLIQINFFEAKGLNEIATSTMQKFNFLK